MAVFSRKKGAEAPNLSYILEVAEDMSSALFISVAGEYSLGRQFHYSDKWRPLKPQIDTPSDPKKYVKIWISRFRALKINFQGGHVPPRPPTCTPLIRRKLLRKLRFRQKVIFVFCYLSAQKVVSAFGYLILHRLQLGRGICQLDCNKWDTSPPE